jgi:ABC-type branched-subunit amino acid transport system ATPase component
VTFGGIRAVDEVSFDIRPGDVVSLIGPNGAGKTTLLNALSGFVRAGGSARLNGRELLRLPPHKRVSRGLGRTFQNVQLFEGMTLLENVLTGRHTALGGNIALDLLRFPVVGRERQGRERAMELLRLLRLESYSGVRVDALPLGIQKLAGVARALATDPSLLLLDEPAAGLNLQEADALGGLIGRLCRDLGLTVLLIEHNMRLVMSASDYIIVLDQGRKLAEGTPQHVAENPAVIAAYLGEVEPQVEAEVRDELAESS